MRRKKMKMSAADLKRRFAQGRSMRDLRPGARPQKTQDDDQLNLIDLLQGSWTSTGRGWNLIALPFKDPSAKFNYRVLMNQYSECLNFKFADENVPNRGVDPDEHGETDQLIDALDYEQVVHQVRADDSPSSNLRAPDGKGIHHEPGLFLQILNHESEHEGEPLSVARLATIPHGDSVLAMGTAEIINGPPTIPNLSALPIRVNPDLGKNPYLAPYKHFEDHPFFGTASGVPGFPGFFPTNANAILQFANPDGRVRKTTILHFDTRFATGGIVNIPFIVEQANAAEMASTFWIMELEPQEGSDEPEWIMQYSQNVLLDFFPVPDNPDLLIRWPHISINTLERGDCPKEFTNAS